MQTAAGSLCRKILLGNDGRDARAYRVAFDQRDVADPDAFHVRDRVERSGSENTVLDSVIAHPALAGKRARRHEKAERQKKCFHALLVWLFFVKVRKPDGKNNIRSPFHGPGCMLARQRGPPTS